MPGDAVDVEAGVPITGNFEDVPGISIGVLPEADDFEGIHTGPYDTIVDTYGVIQSRTEAEGLTPAETTWEYYLSDPESEPDPSQWKTRVVWPVA